MVGVCAARRRPSRLRAGGGILLIVGILALFCAMPASAQEVQAIICREPAQLTIEQPASDSVVREAEVTVGASIYQATQLELYVDGVLDKIVPVGVGDTTVATTLQLTEGTHTIKGVAVDVCQIGNGEASVVLTYQPLAPEPSVGATVPTEVAGVRVGGPLVEASPVTPPPVLSGPIATQLADLFDIVASPASSDAARAPQFPQPARFGLLTVGSLVVIFSQTLSSCGVSGRFLQLAATRVGFGSAASARLVAVMLGALLVVLAFIL